MNPFPDWSLLAFIKHLTQKHRQFVVDKGKIDNLSQRCIKKYRISPRCARRNDMEKNDPHLMNSGDLVISTAGRNRI